MAFVVDVLRMLLWLMPACRVKNFVLSMLGHYVHATATVSSNLVWKVRQFRVAKDAVLGRCNVFKNMTRVSLEEDCYLGSWNLISSHPAFVAYFPTGAFLTLNRGAIVTSRHSLDCSGGVVIGAFSYLAGHHTVVLSHGIDLKKDAQTAYPVEIGEYSFVSTNCVLLGGSALPAKSVLAAGAVLPAIRKTQEAFSSGLWAGVPATWKKEIEGKWFSRNKAHTRRLYVPESDQVFEDVI